MGAYPSPLGSIENVFLSMHVCMSAYRGCKPPVGPFIVGGDESQCVVDLIPLGNPKILSCLSP